MNEQLSLIYEILVDFDNRNPSTLFFPGDLRENDAKQADALGLIAKIWDINDHVEAIKMPSSTLDAIATEAEKIMGLTCNFDSKIYEVTDNIIIEKFDAQPTLLGQLLDGVDSAIASLTKFTFTDTEISQALKMQVDEVLGEADKVIKQNPDDYDYTERRIESSNAENIIKFDGGLDRLLEYAKLLLMRKEDWYIHLIGVKLTRILKAECKYEKNKITITDDKLICKIVEGDFTAIANKPTDLLKKLVDWKVKEYGEEESDQEFREEAGGETGGETGGDSNKLDCRDFPVNAIAVHGRPSRTPVLSYAQLGRPISRILRQNNTRTTNIGSGNNGEVYVLHSNPQDVHEIFVLPMGFEKAHIPISWGDRVVHWSNGRKEHREEMISFYTRTGAISHGKKSPIYINMRMPNKGKFCFFKQGWNNYGITFAPWEWSNPSESHWRSYNPLPNSYASATATQQGEAIAVFSNIEFPGAIFVIPRLPASYINPVTNYIKAGQPPYNIRKNGFVAYASTCKIVKINGATRTEVAMRGYDLGNFRKKLFGFNYIGLYLGSTEPIMEALNYDPQLKPRVRLYSDISGKEFLCCSHDEDREIFKVDFSKSQHPYNTITASDVSKYSEYGQFGFTCIQVHLPPDKQNVYPLVEHVLTNGTGASFRLWDARTGQELKGRFPISVLSVQHH